jgi:hypothetical protein
VTDMFRGTRPIARRASSPSRCFVARNNGLPQAEQTPSGHSICASEQGAWQKPQIGG